MEFCEACRRDRYIGLCYGPPGVGKKLSAIHHSRIQKIVPIDRWSAEASDDQPIDTVFFTPDVINTPARIDTEIRQARYLVSSVAKRATRAEQRATLDLLRSRDEAWHVEHRDDRDYRRDIRSSFLESGSCTSSDLWLMLTYRICWSKGGHQSAYTSLPWFRART